MTLLNIDDQITQTVFSDLVGITQAAVSKLIKSGVLTRGSPVRVWFREYCAHLRSYTPGGDDLDLNAERAALAREQKIKIALQNAVTRKELAPVYLLEQVMAQAGTKVGRILEGIPSKIKRRDQALSADTIRMIAQEIAKARNIAAGISLEVLQEDGAEGTNDDLAEVE